VAIIKVPSRIGSGFGEGLSSFFRVLNQVSTLAPYESIEFDMSGCQFLTPSFLLPLALLIKQEEGKREVLCPRQLLPSFHIYADLISFPSGLKPENIMGGDYESYLEKYTNKTFIPVIDFPAGESDGSTHIRNAFLGVLNSFLKKQLNLTGGVLTAMFYLIDEAVNNIVDHSAAERGFIFAQYYPSRQFVDICISDSGIGILETFKKRPNNQVLTDKDAILNAASGVSTKDLPGAEGRGFGISTSKRMLAEGLDGKYLILSGNAILVKTLEQERIIELSNPLKWAGTIVVLRIPYVALPTFNPVLYYEN
jgi:hypothetical protein